MDNSKEKFENTSKTIYDDGKSFFHMAEMDLDGLSSPSETSAPGGSKKTIAVKSEQTPMDSFSAKNPPTSKPKLRFSGKAKTEYELFSDKRDELANLLGDTAGIMQRLDMIQLTKKLSDLSERIKRDNFKIQIVGNFKNGKSTFINSFLGQEILPAYALPCTAVINEVKYGEEKRAIIHFKNPLPPVLPSELSPLAVKHIKKYAPGKVPPMEVAYDRIEDYVVIPVGKDPKDMLLESPYERVELFWPLPLLKSGIEIIDSPGLNEHTTRTKVTMDFLTKSDAIIFVLNATMLCSRDEMTFIEKSLHSNGFKDLFFVVNRFDMIPEAEQERIMNYAKKNLVPLTTLGEKGLFFVSAKKALESKINGNPVTLNESGLPQLERALSSFLTKKKGALKLLSPARTLSSFLKEDALKKMLPEQRKKLSLSNAEIGKNRDIIQERMHTLERKKEFITSVMDSDISKVYHSFSPIVNNNIRNSVSLVSGWINSYNPTQKFGLMASRDKVSALTDEIMAHVRTMLENTNMTWCKNVLIPEVSAQSNSIFAPAKNQVKDVVQQYGEAKKSDEDTDKGDIYKRINARFMSSQGSKGSVADTSQLVVQLTGTPLLTLLSVFSSTAVKQKACSMFMTRFVNFDSSALPRLKSIIIEEIQSSINSTSFEYTNAVTNEISLYFNQLAEKTVSPLDDEISALQDKLDAVSMSTEKHKSSINSKKEMLDRTEDEIKELCEKINTFTSCF